MNTLIFAVLASLAVFALAKPSGHWDDWHGHGGHWGGHWGGGWDDGHWDDGHWDDGHWDDGSWHGGWDGGHHDVVVGNGAVSVGASAHHGGWGDGHWGGHGGHGVAVVGPHTATATIVGPGHTGKIVSHGLYGVGHGHHGHGHWRK